MSVLDKALFVTTEVHPRPIRLGDGTEHMMHFRELPAVEFRRQHMAENSEDDTVRAAAVARLISIGLCDASGEPVITEEQAMQLRASVAAQMVKHIIAVSWTPGEMGNALAATAKSGSGTSSPSRLAAKALRSGKRRSAGPSSSAG